MGGKLETLLKSFAVLGSLVLVLHTAAAASHMASFTYEIEGDTISLEAEEVEGGEYSWFVNGVIQSEKERTIEIDKGSKKSLVAALKVSKDGETGSTAQLIELGGKNLEANFSVSQEGAEDFLKTGTEIVLDASDSKSGSLDIDSYRWKMDGEDIGTGKVIAHTLDESRAGMHTFRLEVTDSQGNKDTAEKELAVIGTNEDSQDNKAPKAKMDMTPLSPSRGNPILFNAENSNDPDGDIFKYSWFVDGELAKESHNSSFFEFTPSSPRDYRIVLRVKDFGGKTDEAEKTVKVGAESKTLDLDWSPKTPEAGKPVTFSADANTSQGKKVSNYRWYVDDNQVHAGDESEVNLVFPEKGVKQVRAEVMYNNGELAAEEVALNVSFSWAVTERDLEDVSIAPTADFKVATDNPEVNKKTEFDGTLSSDPDGNITDVRWFIDNVPQPASSLVLEKRFEESGDYEVALEVVDDDGFKIRKSKEVEVGLSEESEPPEADISISPEDRDTSTVVILDGSVSQDANGDIESYKWDVDSDGGFDYSSPKIGYVYSSSGSQKVILRVEDSTGQHSTTTETFYVNEEEEKKGDSPKANFDASDLNPQKGQEVVFNADPSSDPDEDIERYRWFINGEEVSNDKEISQMFEESGEHQILLQVVDSNENTDSKIKKVKVQSEEKPEDVGLESPPIPGGGDRSSLRKDVRFGFTPGWNLVSAYGMGSILMDSIRRKCKDELARDKALYIDGGENKKSEIIKPETGYFLEFKDRCTVTISGHELKSTPSDHNLKAGRNTISVPYMTSLEEIEGDCTFQKKKGGYAWHFSEGEWETYDMDDKLQPDKGYFVVTNNQCKLDIEKCGEVRLTKQKGKAAMQFKDGPRCDGTGSDIQVNKKNGEFQSLRVTPGQEGGEGFTGERQSGDRIDLSDDSSGAKWIGYVTGAAQVAAGVMMIAGGISGGEDTTFAGNAAQGAMGTGMVAGGAATIARTAGQEG